MITIHIVQLFFPEQEDNYSVSPLSIAITSIGDEKASLGAFRTFVWFALVWFCLFPLPLGVWEGLPSVIFGTPWAFLLPPFYVNFRDILNRIRQNIQCLLSL